MMRLSSSYKARKNVVTVLCYILLSVLSLIWILPILWVILTSFREEPGSFTPYFWPKGLTLNNYKNLFMDTQLFYFPRWFLNTLGVAICSCLLSTFYVLSVSYVMSRLRFHMRQPLMNVALILGMFPGFMSMIAVYYILKGFGITQSLFALVLVYSAGAGLGFFIAKGFFDTIPKALDEAAYMDGATKAQVFWNITIPMSKPIIIYTVLTTFMGPWMDFIFVSVLMGDNYNNYTVALGMFRMLDREFITSYYTQFAAAAVLVSVPIAAVFISMQKFYVEGVTGGAVKG